MRLNKYITFALSAALVGGITFMSQFGGMTPKHEYTYEAEEAEEEEESEFDPRVIEHYNRLRLNEVTGTVDPAWVAAAVDQANKLRVSNRAAKPLTWTSLGPDNVGGRIRAFLMHRDSANLMFAGGVSGGLFRSNTNGQSWYPVNDMQENLNVTCIGQTVDGTIYYGTGEGSYTNLNGNKTGSPAFAGSGVFKSTNNRGLVFTNIPNTKAWISNNAIVTHPTQNWLWVATSGGVYRTENGGTNWTLVRGGNITDMTIDKDGIVWCSNSSGTIYKGDADGKVFTTTNNGVAPGGRTSIAISPQDPQYVYIMGAAANNTLAGIWRSTNSGQNWELIVAKSAVTEILAPQGVGQGYYNNVLSVDPRNKNKIFIGGVWLASWDNANGYREIASSFTAPWNNTGVHADKHVLQWNMRTTPPTLICGTDGGLFFSQDQNIWTQMNRGFTTLQLYHVAANNLAHVAGGAQDNGTFLINYSGNSFNGIPSKTGLSIYSNDGMDCEFSAFSPKTIFMSDQVGNLGRTANGGQSSSTFWDQRFDGESVTGFERTFSLWEKDSKTSMLFFPNLNQVWVALNPTDFSKTVNWFMLSNTVGSSGVSEVEHTPDGNHLFIAKDNGKVFRIDSIQNAVYDLNTASNVIPPQIVTRDIGAAAFASRAITSVNCDLSNANHVVITCGGYGNSTYVYETDNALDVNPTWKNITGNLPSMPVYDAVIDANDPDRIIIGTELGCWLSENGGTTWEEANAGMARVPVYEIRGYKFNSWAGMDLFIGTHGRGYFRSKSLMSSVKRVQKDATNVAKGYPNPATETISISYEAPVAGAAVVEIFNVNGSTVQTIKNTGIAGENEVQVNVHAMKPGYYFARITQGDKVSTVKFSVTR